MSSLAAATSKMFSGTLVSRLLGQVRLIVLIAALGATAQGDAFQTANTLPNIIYNLIAAGVMNAILVPHIVRAMKRDDDEFVNKLLTMAGTILFGLTVVLTAGSSILLTIYASQMAPEWFDLAVAFSLWCIPQVFFYGIYTLIGNVLNARNVFGPYMWAPVVNNIIAIIGLVLYIVVYGGPGPSGVTDPGVWDATRIAMVGGFATLGVAAQALVLIYPLRKSGFKFRFSWGLRGSGLGSASRMAGWVFAALGVGQLGYLVLVNVASAANGAATAAAPGGPFIPSYVAYTGAFAIYMLPHSLITVSLVTALFTRMAENAADRNIAGVRRDLSFGLRGVGVFTVFAGAAFAVLSIPLVQATLFIFRPGEAEGFGAVLFALSLGIPGLAVWAMVQRVSYAFEDARTLFFIQIPMAVIMLLAGICVFVAPPHLWMPIMCLGTAASQWFGGIVGYLSLRPKLRLLDGGRILRTYFRLFLAVLPAAAVGWLILHFWGAVSEGTKLQAFALGATKVVVVGLIMAAIYFVLLRALDVRELDEILAPILRRFGRGRGGESGSSTTPSTMGAMPERKESAVVPLGAGDLLSNRFRLDALTHVTDSGAELWHARDTVMGRSVRALVVPEEIREAVLDGARRAAILTDPRLAAIVDVGEEGTAGYVVSAEVPGRSAAELTVDDDTARAIVGEAAAALDSGRKRGVHHGALTPTCVTISPQGDVVILGLGYLGTAGVLHAADADSADGAAAEPLSGVSDEAIESRDPVERSIARSQRDADALVALRAALGGSSDPIRARNASEVMRAMAPWGNIVLPPEPEPAKAVPRWTRFRHTPPAVEAVPGADASSAAEPIGVGPAAASNGPRAGTAGPAAATMDPSTWRLPAPADEPAPKFDNIFDEDDESRAVAPMHVGQELPASAVAAEAVAAAASATGVAVSKFAKASAEYAKTQAEKAKELANRRAQERAERKAAQEASEAAEQLPGSDAPAPVDAAHPTYTPVRTAPQLRPASDSTPVPQGERRWGAIVLALTVLATLLAVVWARGVLETKGTPVTLPPRTDPVVVETVEPTPTEESEEPEESQEPEVVVAIPTIKEINVLDPEGDGAENQDLTGRAFDGDDNTFWRSRSYVSPTYGMKSGIGLDIVLKEKALVSTITLELHGEGGHVQIKTDPKTANRADPIAEADMKRTTTIELDKPTELSRVVLWFTSLPTADSDGKNRVELLEVSID